MSRLPPSRLHPLRHLIVAVIHVVVVRVHQVALDVVEGDAFVGAAVDTLLELRVVVGVPVRGFSDAIGQMVAGGERVEPLSLLGVPGVVGQDAGRGDFEALGHIHVLPEAHLVREALAAVDVRAQHLEGLSVEHVAGAAAVEHDLVRGLEDAADEQTISLCALVGDLLATQVGAQVLHYVEHVVSAQQEEVEVLAQVGVHVLPNGARLLPHVVVALRPLVQDVHAGDQRVLLRAEGDETVALLGPGVPRRARVRVVVLLHGVDPAEHLQRPAVAVHVVLLVVRVGQLDVRQQLRVGFVAQNAGVLGAGRILKVAASVEVVQIVGIHGHGLAELVEHRLIQRLLLRQTRRRHFRHRLHPHRGQGDEWLGLLAACLC
eukprot:Colp12_sorted_trinity150504_noHs@17851